MSLNLVYAIDAGFEDLAAISLVSFLVHNPSVRIYCITPADFYPDKIAAVCIQRNIFYCHKSIPLGHHIYQLPDSIRPYFYCTAAFDLLPHLEENVLYVDADTLCIDDVFDLASLQLSGDLVQLAACSHGRPMIDRQLALSLSSPYHYFNAGVFLFRPSLIASDSIVPSIVGYYQHNALLCRFREQCALNAVFKDRVIYLPSSYNYLSWMRPRLSDHIWHNPLHNPFATNLESIRSTVKIVHFSASALPSRLSTDRLEPVDHYWNYLRDAMDKKQPTTNLLTYHAYCVKPSIS